MPLLQNNNIENLPISLDQLLQSLVNLKNIPSLLISNLVNDSRIIQKGDLFLAYPGLSVDGRDYILMAAEKGAAVIVYEAGWSFEKIQVIQNSFPHILLIPMQNIQNQLGEIAARFYRHPSIDMTMIGITGTNGKTSCAHFITQMLTQENISAAVMGTVGNGFLSHLNPSPLTTLDPIQLQKYFNQFRTAGAQVVAMEVSSHALAQDRVQAVAFDLAIFTQLSRDHLDYHGDMISYAASKAKLFAYPGLRAAILNWDDPLGKELAERHKNNLEVFVYSTQSSENNYFPAITAHAIEVLAKGYRMQISSPWGEGTLELPLLGRFNISNILAVIGALGWMGEEFPSILKALSNIKTVPGRMEVFNHPNLSSTVIVDYAHTPDALEKTLLALREHCKGKIYCVFGCGGDRDRGKRPQMGMIAENLAEVVILTNDNPRSESPDAIIEEIKSGMQHPMLAHVQLDRKKAIELAVQFAGINDMVLVAGKGHETTQIIGNRKFLFSDIEVVKELFSTS